MADQSTEYRPPAPGIENCNLPTIDPNCIPPVAGIENLDLPAIDPECIPPTGFDTVKLFGRHRKRCAAKTRKGNPCRCKVIPGKMRCKYHGGMSTGPRTQEGKERIRQAQSRRWHDYRKSVFCDVLQNIQSRGMSLRIVADSGGGYGFRRRVRNRALAMADVHEPFPDSHVSIVNRIADDGQVIGFGPTYSQVAQTVLAHIPPLIGGRRADQTNS